MGEVRRGFNILWPVAALICGEDCPHFRVWGQAAQSKGVRVHEFSYQVCDGWDTCEVVKRFEWGCFEHPCYLTYALILGNLHLGDEALLVDTCVPHLGTIG